MIKQDGYISTLWFYKLFLSTSKMAEGAKQDVP